MEFFLNILEIPYNGKKCDDINILKVIEFLLFQIYYFLLCVCFESLSDLVLKAFRISVWFAIKTISYCIRFLFQTIYHST